MKTILIIGGAALAASLVTPAAAAEFTGPRAEIRAGWDRLGVDGGAFPLDSERSGITYGVGVGYDVALSDKLVAGLEAGFDLSDQDFRTVAGTTTVEAEAKRDIELSARLGAKVADSVLVYAKAGYTNARLEGTVVTGGATGTRTRFAGNGDGARVGAGVELAFGGGLFGKVEYRYSNYEAGVSRHQAITALGLRF